MPSMAPPEIGTPADAPLLALPDHTVAVDLGTPWEEDGPSGSSSNKLVYALLGVLILGLTGFFAYLRYQNQQLNAKPKTEATSSGLSKGALALGKESLQKAKDAYAKGNWQIAQLNAETANMLIKDLKVASKADVKEAVGFYRKATLKYADTLFAKAGRALQAGDTNQTLSLSSQAEAMYAKVSGSTKQQGRCYGLQGQAYARIKDYVNAEDAYRRAAELNPGGGYGSQIASLKQAQMPQVDSAPVDGGAEAPPQVIQPSLGGEPDIPTGRRGSYHNSAPAAPAAAPVAQPSRPQHRQSTYVPPRRDNTPSWRKKPSDVLPTY